MTEIRIRRGPASQLPIDAAAGEPLLTTDTHNIYVGGGPGVMPVKVTGVTTEVQAALAMKINAVDLGTAAAKDVPATGNASAGQVVLGNDTRLTNPRTPTAHKASHAVGGSDAITPADIGAVDKAKLPSYNAADFDGDDIGAKINAAVAYAGTQGGGTVVVPTNSGRVQTPIVITTPHITLKGVGKTATVLKTSDTFVGTDLILVSNASDVVIQDMDIDGNQSVLHSSNLYGVHYLNSPKGQVIDCNIHNLVTFGVAFYSSNNGIAVRNDISDISGYVGSTGVIASNSINVKVLDNNISRCNGAAARSAGAPDDGNGIYFQSGAEGGIASGNTITDCGRRGVKVQASNVTVVNNPRIEDCAQSCVQVQLDGAANPLANVKVLHNTCIMTSYGTYGVVLEEWLRNADVNGNSFTGAFYTGVDVRQGIDGAAITNNTFDGNAGWAIRIENQLSTAHPTNNVKIHGNTVTNCGAANTKPSIEARTGAAQLTNLSFVGNNVTGNGARYAYLIGNNQDTVQFFNNVGSPVSFSGTVTNLTMQQSAASSTASGYILSSTQSVGGGKTIVGNANEVQLTVQGNSTQTTHLQDWKDSSGSIKATLQWTGALGLGGQSNPGVLLHAGAGVSSPVADGGGVNYSPQIQSTPTSGVAGVGAFVNDGTHNRRVSLFADEPNGLVGISTGYGSGGEPPFVVRTPSGEKIRVTSTSVQIATPLTATYFYVAAGISVASASTITPTGPVFHVTGTAAVATINIPFTGFTGAITIIPDAAFTTTTAGNIGLASTAVVGKAMVLTYDGAKWYPSY